MSNLTNIRNFSIIAHVDHGKSTLADRLLEITNTVPKREMQSQILDSNPIERERGITIKLAPVRMNYQFKGINFMLNLIDTPGHVDFSYEVSRSLAACEGAILVVDATQGVQAQTIAHAYKAMENNLVIIPVVNKIDLENAQTEQTANEICETFGFSKEEVIFISAKEGKNIDILLQKIIEKIPPPQAKSKPLRALLFNSSFDPFKGVIANIRVVDGKIKSGDKLKLVAQGTAFDALEIGYFNPKMFPQQSLSEGEVGYIATGLKDVSLFKVGDTITGREDGNVEPLPGYKEPKPFVFVGLFPVNGDDYPLLKDSIEKLKLNDSSLIFEPERSQALGHGYLVGFLGLLHAEITQERLEKEYRLNLIATTPSVEYEIKLKSGKTIFVKNASDFPDPSMIESTSEPITKSTIICPKEYLGQILEICQNRRGDLLNMEYHQHQVVLSYTIPLSEIITDFYGEIKSKSSGYASLDYELIGYKKSDVVRISILVNHEPIDALSFMTVNERAESLSRFFVEKLKQVIPRQQFEIAIQASIGGKVIARSDVKAFRKDVIQKLYGGDRSRKDKLLEAQKKGKKRLRSFGKVEIPQDAFFAIFNLEDK